MQLLQRENELNIRQESVKSRLRLSFLNLEQKNVAQDNAVLFLKRQPIIEN